jgi:alpha-tubulin suppressor-like RCC1 family protein
LPSIYFRFCFDNFHQVIPVNYSTSGAVHVSLGHGHTCIVSANGGVECTGFNDFNQVSPNSGDLSVFTAYPGLSDSVASVECGYKHTCALRTSGTMLCWGQGTFGQMGNSFTTPSNLVPVDALLPDLAGIFAGGLSYCSFALHTNGIVSAFGRNDNGELGLGDTTNRVSPVNYGQGIGSVLEVRGGEWHSCALLSNESVWCTGNDEFGQIGNGEPFSNTNVLSKVLTVVASLVPTKSPTSLVTALPTTRRPSTSPQHPNDQTTHFDDSRTQQPI